MKTLWVGPLLDGTGYSVASNRSVLALDAVGVDIVPRHFKLSGQTIPPPNRVTELMEKSIEGCDTVVQHFLPVYTSYRAGMKNISYFHCETDHFRPSNWQYYLNCMDECWVSCLENKIAAENSGVKIPIKVVPIPVDTKLYEYPFSPLMVQDSRFVFYCIGDFSYRKNIMGLVEAYLTEFSYKDNVLLVLKTYCDGKQSQESTQIIAQEIQNLKKELRKTRIDSHYPRILVITDYLSEQLIYGLHKFGDCFVSMERGAAYNIPAFDAMGFGNQVIVNGHGGQSQFVYGAGTALIDFKMEYVKNMNQCGHLDLYTCYERWADPSLDHTKELMRKAYGNGKARYHRPEWKSEWDQSNKGKILAEALQ